MADINLTTLNNDLNIYKDKITIKCDYAFQGIEIDYIDASEDGRGSRFSSLLPSNYLLRSGTNKILVLKLNLDNESDYVGVETELFTHGEGFQITNAFLATKNLQKISLQVNNLFLENWCNLGGDASWDNLTRNWEDIDYDGRVKIPKWHKIKNVDKEAQTITTTRELRNK